MRIYLDDERPAPQGWIPVRWPDEAIALLETGDVVELSLDHDLGDDQRGTGYDVLLWIEERIIRDGFIPPVLHVHSANPPARLRMQAAIKAIRGRAARHNDRVENAPDCHFDRREES